LKWKKLPFQRIKKGIENTNYLLKTKKNKFILTIFEKESQIERYLFL
jgi:Ser/Thr protein kinase RdoA (MazF antagonist)